MQDEFYNRYLVRQKLFETVFQVFLANGDRYNLLNSAVLELCEFIRKVGVGAGAGQRRRFNGMEPDFLHVSYGFLPSPAESREMRIALVTCCHRGGRAWCPEAECWVPGHRFRWN